MPFSGADPRGTDPARHQPDPGRPLPEVWLVLGHGSRDEAAQAEFGALVEGLAARNPAVIMDRAFVELARPGLEEALDHWAPQASRIIVLPLFLFAAGHVKNDLPLALTKARIRHPRTAFVAARALGVHAGLVAMARERAGQGGPGVALLAVGRGSSDADANADFCKTARLVGEGAGFAWTLPCFIGVTDPRPEAALDLLARLRPARVVVLPYLLLTGRLLTRLQAQVEAFRRSHPWIATALAPHLGQDEILFDLLRQRAEETLRGEAPLPCDTCHYRAEALETAGRAPGLRALLWSVRHGLTHGQAMPHVHAHAPLQKHVLVCANADCAERGSIPLISELRRDLKERCLNRRIRVTRTGCMGRCGEGPAVAVYPDGVWYRGVQKEDAAELVREHLLGERLVARLVDHVMH